MVSKVFPGVMSEGDRSFAIVIVHPPQQIRPLNPGRV